MLDRRKRGLGTMSGGQTNKRTHILFVICLSCIYYYCYYYYYFYVILTNLCTILLYIILCISNKHHIVYVETLCAIQCMYYYYLSLSLYIYIYIYISIHDVNISLTVFTNICYYNFLWMYIRSVFKTSCLFCGLDPGNLKFETVQTNKQHICC